MAAGDLIMAKLNVAIGAVKAKDSYAINKLKAASDALSNVQKIQRLGEEKSKPPDYGVLPAILEYLKNDNDESAG